MVEILLISEKLSTLDLLKIKGILKKGYNFIISVNDITNKILSRDLNDIVDLVMWSEFANSSISMREVIITSNS